MHVQSDDGAKIMIVAISVAYSLLSITFQPRQAYFWSGCFINDTLLAIKGVSPNGRITKFEVLENNRLQRYAFDWN